MIKNCSTCKFCSTANERVKKRVTRSISRCKKEISNIVSKNTVCDLWEKNTFNFKNIKDGK